LPTLDQVREAHANLCFEALQLVSRKGMDYNRYQQEVDTLFNVKATELLGVVDHATQGVLVRLTDKFMRLISLTKDPLQNPENKDESVKDTVKDSINYLIYLYCLYKETREEKSEYLTTEEDYKPPAEYMGKAK
jgi:hypothetical protein